MLYIFIAFLLSCKYCKKMEETIKILADITKRDMERLSTD